MGYDEIEMLNVKHLMKCLGVSRKTLQNYDRQGILKAYYLGGKKYYNRSEVLSAFVEASNSITD